MANFYNFQFQGSASTPQVDDAETSTVLETGEAGITFSRNVKIIDFLSDGSNAQLHQVAIWVQGRKASGNLYTTQINPNNPGRVQLGPLNIVIPAGARVQVKGSQKTGASADPFKVTLVYG